MKVDKLNIRILMSTRQYMLYTVGLGALLLILAFALFIPQSQEAYATFSKIQKERPNTEKLDQKLAALNSIPATAEYAQIEIVEKALPSRKPVLELLTSLSTVSQNTSVVIESFDVSPGLVATDEASLKSAAKSDKSYDSLKVNLEISGTFKQVQDFIIQVERVSPFTTVTQMDLSGELNEAKTADAEQKFKAKLVTETYFFTQSIAVRVESPLPIIAAQEQTVLSALAAFAPINVPIQTEVRGGGSDDLFKWVNAPDDQELLQDLLNQRAAEAAASSNPIPSPTPAPASTTLQ